jgi:hypothetical protein
MKHQSIEDGIVRFYSVTDHIRLLTKRYIDHPIHMTEDEMWNHLAALEAMVELYTESLMDTYCQVYELNEYAPPEVKALRNKIFNDSEVQAALKAVKAAKKGKK